jgi:hypothetical protein
VSLFFMLNVFNAVYNHEAQAWSNLKTANESETRCLRSSTPCPIFNELVT